MVRLIRLNSELYFLVLVALLHIGAALRPKKKSEVNANATDTQWYNFNF